MYKQKEEAYFVNKKHAAIVLGVMCLLLACAIVIQVKTVKSTVQETDPTFRENELRDEVLRWKEKYDNSYAELQEAEKTLEEERSKALENDDSSAQKEEELKVNNTYLGLTDVSGKGITITLTDNQTVTTTTAVGNISDYVIHDIDLMSIINELKNAGAEAISINEQRIVPTSSIVCIGNVARINGERIGAPFVIKAIGMQDMLYENLERPGGYLDELENRYGIGVEVKKDNNVVIAKYTGVLSFEYMKEVE